MSKFRYKEDKYIDDVIKYVRGTYGEHYVAKDIQVIDVWESLDTLETTARDTAIKYLCRYGKKGGKNRKDLLKAIHYIILMMYDADQQAAKHNYLPDEVALQEAIDSLKKQPEIQDSYDKVNNYDTYLRTQ